MADILADIHAEGISTPEPYASEYYTRALALLMDNQLVHSNFYSVDILPHSVKFMGNNTLGNMKFLCEAAELPGRAFSTTSQKTYGPTQKFPTMTSFNDMLLSFVCLTSENMFPKGFFVDWMEYINPSDKYDFKYKNQYLSDIVITQYAKTGHEISRVTITDAFPIAISPQALNFSSPQHQTVQVAFTYLEFKQEFMDEKKQTVETPNLLSQYVSGISDIYTASSNFITGLF